MHLKHPRAAPSRAEICAAAGMQTLHTAAEPETLLILSKASWAALCWLLEKYNLIYYI